MQRRQISHSLLVKPVSFCYTNCQKKIFNGQVKKIDKEPPGVLLPANKGRTAR